MSTVAVLPALDEAEALPKALAGRPDRLRVIVVDNGSTDGTGDLARSLGAEVVVEPRRGFGHACLAGAQACAPGDTVVFVDADGTFAWEDVVAVATPVEDGSTDLLLGWRRPDLREHGAMARHVAVANRVLGAALTWSTGVRLHDLGPLRAIRRDVLLDLGLVEGTYGWPLEMVLAAARRQLRVAEQPVAYRVRAGRSKVTGRPWATLLTVLRMLAVLGRFARTARRDFRRPSSPIPATRLRSPRGRRATPPPATGERPPRHRP